MIIQCTKKLFDELKIVPALQEGEETNLLLAWHANFLKIGRHKFIVLVNDKNRYAIVLYGLKAKDKKNFDTLVKEAIREVFQAESIKDEVIENYLQATSAMVYDKTRDRKLVARLNKACEAVHFAEDLWDPSSIVQVEMSKCISSMLVGDGKKDYFNPNEQMYKDLEEFSSQPVFNTEALVLKVTLDLSQHSVWRRITVPAGITFSKLHDVLQTAFSWQNSHIHDFEIFEKRKGSSGWQEKPSLNLVCHEEAFSYQGEVPMKMEDGYKLKDFTGSKIVYNYDFGDDWKHIIEVEDVINDYTVNFPICTDGEGNPPPEDVGGEMGYEVFLSIIKDSKHPDYRQTKEWGEMQGYVEFDKDEVNWQLRKF
ncbi:plasmid pRiA4b ORF-3 family protein [Sutcliffiella horikoshii]|uniref:plasmid pRiA4b ORF-3 family protein n=1 Tax=Sutcliffiella horikoshii TaxID=79883 RepID=UPI001CBF7DF1|nr:plasmid pRiA4b ORF-3 family protein [Sutcliffiella horikoshii]UAL47131.1 plasmid pRiA4b ORF-3 family protein [Sutcliffiella horikoshii]